MGPSRLQRPRTNLKGQGMGVRRWELVNREGTGRRDQAGYTTRTTITSTRDRSTVQMELGPVGWETGGREKAGFSNKE